jgi:hypothetical protein
MQQDRADAELKRLPNPRSGNPNAKGDEQQTRQSDRHGRFWKEVKKHTLERHEHNRYAIPCEHPNQQSAGSHWLIGV